MEQGTKGEHPPVLSSTYIYLRMPANSDHSGPTGVQLFEHMKYGKKGEYPPSVNQY